MTHCFKTTHSGTFNLQNSYILSSMLKVYFICKNRIYIVFNNIFFNKIRFNCKMQNSNISMLKLNNDWWSPYKEKLCVYVKV